jgi:hypothetical protein
MPPRRRRSRLHPRASASPVRPARARAARRTGRGDGGRGRGRARVRARLRPCARPRVGRAAGRSPARRRRRGRAARPGSRAAVFDLVLDPPPRIATTGRPVHIDSATVARSPRGLVWATTSARRWSALTITAFSSASCIGNSALPARRITVLNETPRSFRVRRRRTRTIAGAGSPWHACEAIPPRSVTLLADPTGSGCGHPAPATISLGLVDPLQRPAGREINAARDGHTEPGERRPAPAPATAMCAATRRRRLRRGVRVCLRWRYDGKT